MTNKTVTLSLGKDEEGKTRVYWNGMELETVDQVKFNVVAQFDKPYIEVSLLLPSIDIQTSIEDIQLTSEAYQRCGLCGKWVIPSIDKNLNEKIVTAEYKCETPHEDGSICNWTKSVEIQNWNNGIQGVQPITHMPEDDKVPRDEILKSIQEQ